MKALVTGGTGFVGREIVRTLRADGVTVRVLSRRHPENLEQLPGVEVIEGDLSDILPAVRAMDGVELVFHAGEIRNTSRRAARRNLKVLSEMAEHGAATGLQRFVFVSSITVAGIPARMPADEQTPPAVTLEDHYTGYKRAAESVLARHKKVFETVIVRPAPVYGTGSRVLPGLVGLLRKFGKLAIPFAGNGENLVPLIHIRDLGRAIAAAGTVAGAAGHVFNLTDGTRHRWRDLFSAILETGEAGLRILPFPAAVLKPPAFLADLFTYPFGISGDLASYIDYFSSNIFFENKKAQALLEWKPEVGLEEGIREMIDEAKGGDP